MKKWIVIILFLFISSIECSANNIANTNLQITIPPFLSITPVGNPVLVANMTNRKGNLDHPLFAKFRVISNHKKATLYLSAVVRTENGDEKGMFNIGGSSYVAFTNISSLPSSNALLNCKLGNNSNSSPGVIAFPVISVTGGKATQLKDKYSININNGITYITINLSSHVLPSSFGYNDPLGIYMTTITLTEIEN